MISDAPKEEDYYNSESEGKDIKDAYIQATCEETFGKECYEEEFWEDYHNNTDEKKNNKHSDKSKAISRRLKEIYKERNKIYDQEET